MAVVIDTEIAIHLRDGDKRILGKISALDGPALMSIVTRVELEGGVYRYPEFAAHRRARLDAMLSAIPVLPFDDAAAEAYGDIVAHAGYSRRKFLDRMIAAQAVVHRAALATLNSGDFADIPGLEIADWS